MRTLRFKVAGQLITPDPNCDFSGLVPGTSDYLRAEFDFSKEWDGTLRVVGFYSPLGNEYAPQPLKEGTWCVIPAEVTAKKSFKVRVFGRLGNYTIITDKVLVTQNGGAV